MQLNFTFFKTTEGFQKLQRIFVFVILYFQTISFKLREHFNKRNIGADFSGHDVKSLKAKIVRFKTRGTLPLTNHF